jgi:hypothetical protein
MPPRKKTIKKEVKKARVSQGRRSMKSKVTCKGAAPGGKTSKGIKMTQKDKKQKKNKDIGEKQYMSRNGAQLTLQNRVSKYPKGCSRCRFVPGCTVSCWSKRDF